MNDTPWRALLTLWMSLWHQMWFQSLHTGQALLYRHSWPIFGPLGPFWWPQKGNFMSKLIPFAPPIVTNPAFWPLKRSSYAQNNQIWSQMSDDAPSGWSPKVQCILVALYGILAIWGVPNGLIWAPKWAPMVQKWVMLHNKYHVPTSGHFGPSDDLFRGQKVGFVTIGGYKGDQYAHEIALWGPPKGIQ